MIVNPVMYGGGSAEMKTVELSSGANSGSIIYVNENLTMSTKVLNKLGTLTLDIPAGTTIISTLDRNALSVSGATYISVFGTSANKYYLFYVDP